MKKTLIALLALGSVAMAANVTVTNTIDSFSGDTHAADRLDFNFKDSTNRTVTITTTGDATIGSTDGYDLNRVNNILIFNITGTLKVSGTFKGLGGVTEGSKVVVNTALTTDEAEQLISTTPVTVSRDLITGDYLQNIAPDHVSVTLTNMDDVDGLTYGGMLAKVVQGGTGPATYYKFSDVTMSNGYLGVSNSAQAVELEIGKAYGYVTMYAKSGAAAKAVGFVAYTPEPATATLSLLALAGLASRRRRH